MSRKRKRTRRPVECSRCGWDGVVTITRWGHTIKTLPYVHPGPPSWRDGVCASCVWRAAHAG